PPDPGPTKWAGVLANIEAALAPRSQAAGPAPRSVWSAVRWGGLAAAAAAVALAVGAPGPRWPAAVLDRSAPQAPVQADAPFPLLTEGDVNILSVRPADAAGLLVGVVPMPDEVELVSATDVTVHSPRPDDEPADPMIGPAPRGD